MFYTKPSSHQFQKHLFWSHHSHHSSLTPLVSYKINVFGTDGFKTVWRRKGEEYKEKCMVPTVKHGGSVFMWGCMSAAGVGELHFIDGIMNSQMYCSILKEKMLP